MDRPMNENPEMSLSQFVNNVWFKGLARGAMFLACGFAGYAGVTVANINTEIGKLKIAQTEQGRAIEATSRDLSDIQATVDAKLGSMATAVQSVNLNLNSIEVAIGEINGKLSILSGPKAAGWHPATDISGLRLSDF
jgi:hypothetical protein